MSLHILQPAVMFYVVFAPMLQKPNRLIWSLGSARS